MRKLFNLIFIIALLAAGTLISEQKVGSNMELADFDELKNAQPIVLGLEAPLPDPLPDFETESWLNSGSVNKTHTDGKVVLVYFWNYSCIDCFENFSTHNEWQEKYLDVGLKQISIHTPQFEDQKDINKVKETVFDQGIAYAVGVDNDYKVWRTFHNRFWPAVYLYDREGNLTYTHFGKDNYLEIEDRFVELLKIDGALISNKKAEGPDTILGIEGHKRFVGPNEIRRTRRSVYQFPNDLPLFTWALEGSWTVNKTYSEVHSAPAGVKMRYKSKKVLVSMEPLNRKQTKVNVYLDGDYVPKHYAGRDLQINATTGESYVKIEYAQPYELISGADSEHVIELEIFDPEIRVHSVTFDREE